MVLPQLSQAEDSNSWDYRTILQQLSRVYDNPNKVQEAEDKLFALKQGTDSVSTYTAKFERVLYEARGQDWPDVNKISTFRNGLSATIRNRLSQQLSLPRTYTEFVRIVQQLAGSSSSFQGNGSSHGRQNAPYSQSNTQKPTEDAMDIGYINGIEVIQPSTSSRARSVSPNQRNQLRKQGRCVRCGSADHWVAKCPLQPHKPGKVTISAINDDYNGSDSSSEDGRVRQLIQYQREHSNA
jgi:hypothetical protein